MNDTTAGTIVGLAVAAPLFGCLVWLVISAIVDDYRFHRDIAEIRSKTRQILIRAYADLARGERVYLDEHGAQHAEPIDPEIWMTTENINKAKP